MDWKSLVYVLAAGLLVWFSLRMIRGNPGAFSRANISKSITTMGFITLLLIGVVALCVWFLKQG